MTEPAANLQSQRGAGDATPSTRIFTDSDVSPLQIFVQAKKNINDIFVDVDDYIGEAADFVRGESNG
jgi:hypothetical protein